MSDQDGDKPKAKKHITPKIMLGVIFIFIVIIVYEGYLNLENIKSDGEFPIPRMIMRMPF